MIDFLLETKLGSIPTAVDKLFIQKPVIQLHYNEPEYELAAWGDPISDENFKKRFEVNKSAEFIIKNIYGHYYYIFLDKKRNIIYLGNSLFSILPIYYFTDGRMITVSENALTAGKYLGRNSINKNFILEMLLFNYPLFNFSIIEGIGLLPSNSYIKISGSSIEIVKHTSITDLFSSTPRPWKNSTGELSEIFLSTATKYFPGEHYAHALTGGFDGRTLVSAGLYYEKIFSCFSFGSEQSKDVQIASQVASKAGLPFIHISLDDEYVKNYSRVCGEEFIMNSTGSATFARAHYLYAAKQLANNYRFIVTGNFGSEIFRAAHTAGAMITSNLYALFASVGPDEGIRTIENSTEFRCLEAKNLNTEIEELKDNILTLPCYDESFRHLTNNQKFYVFVFEELFRKYFGAEMVNQFKYLKNRTPFIDIDFLTEILKTELAGIHSDFPEHNPFKRYKGQVLYAHIIRKAFPVFGKLITDKGYKPDDLITMTGKLHIAGGYAKKIMKQSSPDFDPYSVRKAWEVNRNFWNSIPVSSEYFRKRELMNNNNDILFKALSLSYLLNNC